MWSDELKVLSPPATNFKEAQQAWERYYQQWLKDRSRPARQNPKGPSSGPQNRLDQWHNPLNDKAHRPPPPEDLVPQFPLIRVATRAFSIPCIEEAGLEADDIIACYVTEAKKAGWKVTIVSSDKDLMQLIDEDAGIDMLDTMNDRRIGRAEVLEKFGVPPEKVGDVLALMGDSVDNVPGVPGIGPKTASQLIQQFGDLETVLASTDQISKPKLKQSLIDFAADARLSRELVRLVCDSKLPEPLDGLALKGIPKEPLEEFLADQGFKTLLARLNAGGPAPGRSSSGGGINDVMTALDRKPSGPPRPSRSRSTALSMKPSPTRRRSTAGSRGRQRRAISRSTPKPIASTASSPGWQELAWRPLPTRPATSPSGTAAPTSTPMRPTSFRWTPCSPS